MMYANDYKGVVAAGGSVPPSLGNQFVGVPWMDYLTGRFVSGGQYIDSQTPAQHCPKNMSNPGTFGPKSGGGTYALIQPTTYLVKDPAVVSVKWDPNQTPTGTFSGIRLGMVKQSTDYILLIDSAMQDGNLAPLYKESPAAVYSLNTWLPQSPTGGGQCGAVWLAHLNKANALFADGHTETCEPSRILGASNLNPDSSSWKPLGGHGISQWWDFYHQPRHY